MFFKSFYPVRIINKGLMDSIIKNNNMNSTIKIEHFASFRINKTIVKKNLKYLKHNLIVTNKKKRNEKFEEILSDITLCESDYEF
ncbi:hypothetical protein pb186bvf_011183 [Paramecium bursaria]